MTQQTKPAWPEFKEHFSKAYENRIASEAGTAGANNYYSAANIFETDDDNIIQSTKESFTTIQLSNSTNLQVIKNNMLEMTHDTQELQAALVTT